jgi:hypothetical protein
MLAGSFRLVTARLIPGETRCKQALLLAAAIVAGCGGSSARNAPAAWQSVRGPGFSFQAPAGWKVERAKSRVSVSHDSELVQVSTFPLLKPYDAKLFDRVARELRLRMRQIAGQTNGRLSGERTVSVDGIRAHAYEVTVGDKVDEYVFVLVGRREYLLLCRRSATASDQACARLTETFSRT